MKAAKYAPSPEREPALARSIPGPIDHRAPAGRIAWWLWVLLVGSLVFFALVRVHVRREESRFSARQKTVPFLQTTGPTTPVRPGALDLSWADVPGAAGYRISVASVTGRIVVDALPVDGTQWTPPDDALPAFTRGEYRWSVEAFDQQGRVLSRSDEAALRLE